MVVRQGKVRKRVALKKLLLVLKSSLKKFRFLIKRRKNKKMHCRSRLRSGSGGSLLMTMGLKEIHGFSHKLFFLPCQAEVSLNPVTVHRL